MQQFDELIDSYIEHKTGISGQLFSPALINSLREQAMILHHDSRMIQAGIGSNESKSYDLQIRRDKIYWIDKLTASPAEQEFFSIIDEYISYLNRVCYAGINDYEFHYAVYEPGSFYKRHLDQFRYNNARKFSLITYLNEDWTDDKGGALIIYNQDKTTAILPTGGTTVFFKSDELEHEVATSLDVRMSITGWLKSV